MLLCIVGELDILVTSVSRVAKNRREGDNIYPTIIFPRSIENKIQGNLQVRSTHSVRINFGDGQLIAGGGGHVNDRRADGGGLEGPGPCEADSNKLRLSPSSIPQSRPRISDSGDSRPDLHWRQTEAFLIRFHLTRVNAI